MPACRYFFAFTFDTTLGLAFTVTIHKLFIYACQKAIPRCSAGWLQSSLFAVAECGSYGGRTGSVLELLHVNGLSNDLPFIIQHA